MNDQGSLFPYSALATPDEKDDDCIRQVPLPSFTKVDLSEARGLDMCSPAVVAWAVDSSGKTDVMLKEDALLECEPACKSSSSMTC